MGEERRTVSCPRCSAPVRWGPESLFRPFCSDRCKTNDLGAWANEEYRVPVTEQKREPEDQDRGA